MSDPLVIPLPVLTVGRLIAGNMQAEVTVQGEVVTLAVANRTTKHGFTVSFSSLAISELNDILAKAVKVSQGRG
jgi:hypothetical protein